MAWVSVHQQIRDHRKTRDLFRRLNISRQEAIGILVLIWTWAIDNCKNDGELLSVTVDDIADAAYWRKEPQLLFQELKNTGWIDEYEGKMYLHDWYEFNKPFYDYLERKEKDKQRKRSGKHESNSVGNSTENPVENLQEFHDSHSPAPAPSPNTNILYSNINKENDFKIPFNGNVELTQNELDKLKSDYPHMKWLHHITNLSKIKSTPGYTSKDSDYQEILKLIQKEKGSDLSE